MTLQEILSYDFLRYTLISACLLGPTCALLGVFVTLRSMSFFSDALAHSTITGLALGWFLHDKLNLPIDPTLFIIPFSLFLAIIMQWLMQRTTISPDTIIAFSFSGSVALGVLIISSLDRYSLIEGILFGSIYANGPSEILRQSLLAIAVLAFLFWQIRPLTLATLSPTIAEVRRIHTRTLSLSFALLTALTITIAQPMLGALLLSALIVIPSAAAKLVSQSFRQHILLSLLIGLLVPPTGVVLSCKTNLPTAPSIVLLNILVLIFCHILPRLLQLFKNKHHPSFPLYTQ